MQDIVSKRVQSNFQSIGFQSEKTQKRVNQNQPEHFATNEDLLEFGFIPELIGRLPVIGALEQLTKEALFSILTDPQNSLVKQYKQPLTQ